MKKGMLSVYCGHTELFSVRLEHYRDHAPGEFIRHHGSLYVVTSSVTQYSGNIDSFDVCVDVAPVSIMSLLWADKNLRAAVQELKESLDMDSDASVITRALRMSCTLERLRLSDESAWKRVMAELHPDDGLPRMAPMEGPTE
jgi:hypothetical protein